MWAAELMQAIEELGLDEEFTWKNALYAVDKFGYRVLKNTHLALGY
jgi:hypothetical protein